jgi:hypothetical protein
MSLAAVNVAEILEAQLGHPWDLGKALYKATHKPIRANHWTYSSNEQYFLSKVVFGLSDCWYWNGCLDNAGYGIWSYNRPNQRAHRVMFELFGNEYHKSKKILHKCDARNCVNPEHLYVGTQADNVRDMVSRGRHKPPTARFGFSNPLSKLTTEDIIKAKSLRSEGLSHKRIGKELGFSTMTIFRLLTGRSWNGEHKRTN